MIHRVLAGYSGVMTSLTVNVQGVEQDEGEPKMIVSARREEWSEGEPKTIVSARHRKRHRGTAQR